MHSYTTLLQRLAGRTQGRRATGRLSVLFGILILLSVIGSYIVITRSKNPLGPDPQTVLLLTMGNLVLLLGLMIVVVRRLLGLWSALREGSVGSRLQTRVVTVFGLVTILPAAIISIFAAVFFHYGIKSWFDERVSKALEESVAVAEAYLIEHKETVRQDALAVAALIKLDLNEALLNPAALQNILNSQATLRSLTEALVLQHDVVLARTRLSFSLLFERLPDEMLARARQSEVVVTSAEDKVSALVLVDDVTDTFLYVTRLVDSQVLDHMEQTQGAVSEYRRLQSQIRTLQLQFSVVFVIVTLVLLLTVMWYGIVFASRLGVPLSRLVKATERVRAGDFSIRVETESNTEDDEISILIRRFNRMTEQLQAQRGDLTLSNRLLDERRRFSEAVLEGASAGVIALDPRLTITLCNGAGAQFLGFNEKEDAKNKPLTVLMPEIAPLLQQAVAAPKELHQGDLVLPRESRTLTLHARITAEMQGERVEGYVVTFDDISPLVSAQRRAAWSDVARRIAHEIKNPLTPIQLSTERLRKKYMPGDAEERAAFTKYLDTISRHVSDIGSMVEEFVSFARMPQPVFRKVCIEDIIQKSVFSAETAFPNVAFMQDIATGPTEVLCDERQVTQVMSNILKNAAESIEQHRETEESNYRGEIIVRTHCGKNAFVIEILDNGKGFPAENIEKLLEPYVTTRTKGTGLGLAIVKKIMEDHRGSITLSHREDTRGANVTLSFPMPIAFDATKGYE